MVVNIINFPAFCLGIDELKGTRGRKGRREGGNKGKKAFLMLPCF